MTQSQSAQLGGNTANEKVEVFPKDLMTPLLSDDEEKQYANSSSLLQRPQRANTESTTNVDLDDGGSPRDDTNLHDEKKPKLTPTQILKQMTVVMITVGGAAASLAAFVVSPAVIVYVAGGICLFNTPIVLYKEHKISTIPS